VLGGILAATLLVSGGALAYRAFENLARPNPTLSAESATAASADGLAVETVVADAPRELQPPAQLGESVPLAAPLPAPAMAALEPAPMVAPTAAVPTEAAPSRPRPTEAELRAALRATPIVMYSTSWCGVCRKARQFLTDSGFRYQEIDADTTPGGWDKVQQLGGRKAVPVIVVDGDVSVGLSADRILKSAARSMERRLGITGVEFRSN
jgi:glutaredoxin